MLSATSLPPDAAARFSTNNLTTNATGVLTIDATNITAGKYLFAVEAGGGATQSLAMIIQSAHIWTGGSFTNGGSADFSLAGNWLNGNIPTSTSDVVLYNSGGQGDQVTTTNIIISSDTEIASLRTAITAAANRRHNIRINDGATLKISGQEGLKALRDRSDTTQDFQLAFYGLGGTLYVTNPTASILTINQANQNGRFLLDGLGLFVADVYSVGLADQRSFPNWFSLNTNGYTGNALPQQGPGGHNYLARTNIIKCAFAGDPNDWNHPAIRDYSMVVARNDAGGSTQRNPFRLGISNVFMMNSFCYAAGASPGLDGNGAMVFNPSFTASNPVAIFRGPAGMNDRMAMFAMSDGAGIGASSSAAKSVVNFTGGAVDMLVDRIYLSRERTNSAGSPPSAAPSATLTMTAGIIDANHVILGFQGQGNNLGPGAAWCAGTLNVNGGTLRVNQTLELGHTTADAGHTTDPGLGFGQITISGNATLLASNITVGGVTKASRDNRITLNNGGTIIVTNQIAGSDKKLAQLNMSNSRLVLHVDGALTDPYVYATNLITGGSSNALRIATVAGLVSDPQTVKLIAYDSAAPNFLLELPAGLYGYLENDTVNKTINAVISTIPPKTVVWNGSPGGGWDTASANWQGGLTFVSGDSARFDDSAAGGRTVTVGSTVTVGAGGVVVNIGPAYTLTGAGLIGGTSTMTKDGIGGLTVDTSSQLPLTINAGSVSISSLGSVGLTTVGSGVSLANAGSINGLRSSGVSVNSGNIAANGVTVSAGTFLNTGYVNGALNVSSNAAATNSSAGTVGTVGTSTIASGAILVNEGGITNTTGRITINGLLMGNGLVRDIDFFNPASPNAGIDGRLQIAAGGTISPGSGPGNIGLIAVEGRFDTDQNANLVIEVAMDGSSTNHDIVAPDYWGAIRCNVIMTNIGALPFAAGQSFLIVSNHNGALNDDNVNPNRDFKFVPPSPGLGLLWDGVDLFTNGIARIKTIPLTPTSVVATVSSNQMTLQWPAGYIGWELQQQITALTNGISPFTTNWTTVANSAVTNQVIVTINPATGAAFYRLVHPTFY